jgi:hypothetical protein
MSLALSVAWRSAGPAAAGRPDATLGALACEPLVPIPER